MRRHRSVLTLSNSSGYSNNGGSSNRAVLWLMHPQNKRVSAAVAEAAAVLVYCGYVSTCQYDLGLSPAAATSRQPPTSGSLCVHSTVQTAAAAAGSGGVCGGGGNGGGRAVAGVVAR